MPGCSEAVLVKVATELAREANPGDWILLEGPMGSGKSTFARAFLSASGIQTRSEGSPTYAIAHEYSAKDLDLIHIDLYRLKNEAELDEAGVPDYFWGRARAVVLCEWASQWNGFRASLKSSPEHRVIEVKLDFMHEQPELRELTIDFL